MVSGYTLTTFPNAFILQQLQLKGNNQQTSTVHVQTRNRDHTLISGGFYPAIKEKGKGKTEEEKERGTSQPSIHQKKDKLELRIISLILYLKSNCEQTS